MNFSVLNYRLGALVALISLTLVQPVIAKDLIPSLTEEFIRATLDFDPDETLKYSECTDTTHPTCNYIWGEPHKKDEARINAGIAPEGNKLTIIFAQAARKENFKQATADYSDGEPIDNLGITAVWSPRRHQLSLITDTFLILHVAIEDSENNNSRTIAVDIANQILAGQ